MTEAYFTERENETNQEFTSGYGPTRVTDIIETILIVKDEERRLSRFNGRSTEDCKLCRIRAETVLEG